MAAFNLITGFLGSGKTTLLSNLLQELSPGKKIAVIQNEFAASGIDGKELKHKSEGFKLVEINNGSVFCVCQLHTFVQSMQTLIEEYQPELIFLEASGLADPISIVELLQTDQLKDIVSLDKIISLVDGPNFFKGLRSLVRFKHQIMIADKIILNKIDLINDETNEAIHKELKLLNPYAEIILTTYGRVNWEALAVNDTIKSKAAQEYKGQESEGRPDMKACVLRTHDKISDEQLRNFIEELHWQCPRIKGHVNLNDGRVISVHSVFDSMEFVILENYVGPSELIAFGDNLMVTDLRKKFKKYSTKNSM
ncbi:GTP-binding protein [Marinifilum sp. RC60d5]|uniref:GTP-binding protein n=1 Tax=Marinifilum sp. RC60d5 TaxID=3458414 RepID=UPI00403569B7